MISPPDPSSSPPSYYNALLTGEIALEICEALLRHHQLQQTDTNGNLNSNSSSFRVHPELALSLIKQSSSSSSSSSSRPQEEDHNGAITAANCIISLQTRAQEVLSSLLLHDPHLCFSKDISPHGQPLYIIKPCGGSCGKGIVVVEGVGEVVKEVERRKGDCIVQKYIENPLLIGGKKLLSRHDDDDDDEKRGAHSTLPLELLIPLLLLMLLSLLLPLMFLSLLLLPFMLLLLLPHHHHHLQKEGNSTSACG